MSGQKVGLALLLLAVGGCVEVAACKSGTLLVHVTLDTVSATADQLQVTVTVGSNTPLPNPPQTHTPGVASGNIEIDFPTTYPSGSLVTVEVRALRSGVTIGDKSKTTTLLPGCTSTALSFVVVADLALVGDATTSSDLARGDAASFDLSRVDFVSCVPVTENCFNGVDDDCNGLIDCADPACTGGASPRAVCVPSPGSFTAGVTVATLGGVCPSAWPSPTTLNAGLNATCSTTGCSGCSVTSDDGPPDSCDILVTDATTDSTCGSYSGNRIRTTGGCTAYTPVPSGDYHSVAAAYYDGYCTGVGGTATKPTPTWTTSELFCSGGGVGGGCGAGDICVPAGANHCVEAKGSQLACPPSYVLNTTRYYTSFDDSMRSCACACNTIGTGTCSSGTASVGLFSGSCGAVGATLANGCANGDISEYDHAEATGVSVTSHVSCSLGTKQTNSTMLLDERTLCCTP